jgi:hypothetical protein
MPITATAMNVLPMLGLSRAMLFFIGVRVDTVLGVPVLPAVIDSLEMFVIVVATTFLTMPTLVKASPFNSTTDPDPTIAG